MYYPTGEGFFPRNPKLSNWYGWAVTMFFLNDPSVFCGRISFPLQLLHWCTKIACYASVSHHCLRAEPLVQRVDLADFTQAAVLQDGHGLGRTAIDGL